MILERVLARHVAFAGAGSERELVQVPVGAAPPGSGSTSACWRSVRRRTARSGRGCGAPARTRRRRPALPPRRQPRGNGRRPSSCGCRGALPASSPPAGAPRGRRRHRADAARRRGRCATGSRREGRSARGRGGRWRCARPRRTGAAREGEAAEAAAAPRRTPRPPPTARTDPAAAASTRQSTASGGSARRQQPARLGAPRLEVGLARQRHLDHEANRSSWRGGGASRWRKPSASRRRRAGGSRR